MSIRVQRLPHPYIPQACVCSLLNLGHRDRYQSYTAVLVWAIMCSWTLMTDMLADHGMQGAAKCHL